MPLSPPSTQAKLPLDSDKAKELINNLQNRAAFTSDFHKLKRFNDIILFVYDEFRRNGKDSGILKSAKYLGEAKTCTNNFVLKNNKIDHVAFVNNNGVGDLTKGYIKGEAYAVPPELFFELDWKRQNFYSYNRVERSIFLLEQTYKGKDNVVKNPSVIAKMYLGEITFWEDKQLYYSSAIIPHGEGNGRRNKYYEYIPGIYARRNVWGGPLGEYGEDEHFYGFHH